MPGKKIESVFLDDVPCYEDSAFEIHNKVADAIVDEIENNSPANIAILGEWGSGKSTVLNYVKAKLDSDAIFFTFDAWAHSGDSLRRNFIESLNAAIIAAHEVGQSDESEAKKLVERLRTESQSITERMYGTETITSTSEQSSLKPIPASLLIAAGIFIFFNTCLNAMAPILKGIAVSLSIIPAGINYELAQFIPAVSFLLSCIVWYFAYKYISESYQDNSRKASKSDDEKNDLESDLRYCLMSSQGFFRNKCRIQQRQQKQSPHLFWIRACSKICLMKHSLLQTKKSLSHSIIWIVSITTKFSPFGALCKSFQITIPELKAEEERG